VIVVVVVSLAVYGSLALRKGTSRVVAATVAALLLLVCVVALENANSADLLASRSPIGFELGRLASGIQNIDSNGASGFNARFGSTITVFRESSILGRSSFGLGPATAAPFLNAEFGKLVVTPNAIWVEEGFDFGFAGLLLFGVAFAVALVTAARREDATVFIPFMVAALLNSAEGPLLYQFTFLAMFLMFTRYSRFRAGGVPVTGQAPGSWNAESSVED
jgi:hypothetical protein